MWRQSNLRFATVLYILCLCPLGGTMMAQSTAEQTPPCPNAPAQLPQMTYDEDVRYLANAQCRSGILDSLQYIPLDRDNSTVYLSLGFWIRERADYASNPNFSPKPPGNITQMQRYFLHTDLHLGDRFRFYGELASSINDGRNGGPRAGIDKEKMYVHQGFFDLGLWRSGSNSLTVRAGRQEVGLGSDNFVSTRDGRNIRRSVDGARLTWVDSGWTVDLLAFKPITENTDYFNDPPSHGNSFWSAYAVHPFRFLPKGNIDLYYMGLDNRSVPFDGKGTGREQRETVGTRLWGTTSHWDYNWEPTFQWGWFRNYDIRAWAVSTETGYRLPSTLFSPRFGLKAVAFSGDRNPAGHTLGTFNSIYELGPYFSYAELFARRNLIALQPTAAFNVTKSLTFTLNPAFFWRESTSDGLYAISNSIEISGLHSNARYIASQGSARLQWRMSRNYTWFSEFGHFFPGEFLKETTPGRNLNYWTGWLDIRY